jgi:hypothetical protein
MLISLEGGATAIFQVQLQPEADVLPAQLDTHGEIGLTPA